MGCTKIWFLIVGGNQRNNEKYKGTSQNQFFLDYLSFPLVSFDFLWFGAGWIRWFSFVFFWFPRGKQRKTKSKEKLQTNQGKSKQALNP